jgi:hypothetical protein
MPTLRPGHIVILDNLNLHKGPTIRILIELEAAIAVTLETIRAADAARFFQDRGYASR